MAEISKTRTEEMLEKMQHTLDQMLAAIVDIKLEVRDEREELCIDNPDFDYTKEDVQGEIPQRAANALFRHKGITVFGDLAKLTEKELLAIPGVGPIALHKINRALEWRGLNLKKGE